MDPLNITEFPHRRLSVKEAARILGITTGSLHNWRTAGMGPAYYKEKPDMPTSRVWYVLSDVLDWLKQNSGQRVEPSAAKNAEAAYERQKAS